MAITSLYSMAEAAGGIYSTITGAGTAYDKAEAFAHDVILLVLSAMFFKGALTALTESVSLCRSAAKELVGRKTRLRPSEVIAESRSSKYIADYDDLLAFAEEYLDADGIQFLRNTMTENGNRSDVSELRKVARVLEQGKEKVGRSLTKEEIQAGLDALWNDGGVEGALAAVEFYHKWGQKVARLGELRNSLPEKYQKITVRGYKTGNIAFSSSEIEGYSIKEIKAFSQYGNQGKNGVKNPVAGWVSSINNPTYSNQVLKVNANGVIDSAKGYLRNNDTEYKIIEYYNQMLKGNYGVKGKISIVSERDICPSCDNVIKAFSKEYSNLVIELISSAGKTYAVKNGILY